jgi:O-antigen/teichoic acid export membrane protein
MIRENIVANLMGRGWGFISVYLFVPLYLRFLGIEAFGLVGFYGTLLGVLAFADMGFTATLNRELARLSVSSGGTAAMRDVLRTYEIIYGSIATLVALLVWLVAPVIALHWLRSSVLEPQEMAGAIRVMGVAIAFQLPAGLYVGGLMGLQRQQRANGIQIGWSMLRGGGAVLVLWLFSPTIGAFASWQVIANVAYCAVVRFELWRALHRQAVLPEPRFKWGVLQDTWRYAAGMAALSVIGILLTQIDKLAVSKILSLEMLGYYSLAGALAAVPITLASAIASAVFPRFTGLVALGDQVGLSKRYHETCELVAVGIVPLGLTLALFSGDALFAWTGSPVAAKQAGLVASLLLGGQLLQVMAVIPLNIALAHGNVRVILLIGFTSVALITPLLINLITKYGIVGAGVSWVVVNACTLPLNMYLLHRRFLPGEFRRYGIRSIGRPLLAAFLGVALFRWALPHSGSRLLICVELATVWVVAVTASAATIPGLWRRMADSVGQGFRVVSSKTDGLPGVANSSEPE